MVSKMAAQSVVNLAAGIAAAWGGQWESAGAGHLVQGVEPAKVTHPDSGAVFLLRPEPHRGKTIITADASACMTPELARQVHVDAEHFTMEASIARTATSVADELNRKGAVHKAERIAVATTKTVRIYQAGVAATAAVMDRLVAAGGGYAHDVGDDEVAYRAGDISVHVKIGSDTVAFTGRDNRLPIGVAEAFLAWLTTEHASSAVNG